MTVKTTAYGVLPDGRRADLFLLDGGEGVCASVTNYGGILTSLTAPDRRGTPGEVCLGLSGLDEYAGRRNFFGAIVGRCANRIRNGQFILDGAVHRLWTNEKGVHLHGGEEGFNRKVWSAETERDGVRLEYDSPDGEENYPGNLRVTVRYLLKGRELRLEYRAVADRPTVVNLTNHAFFNLNCCSDSVLLHEVTMRADRYTVVDAAQLPTGVAASVAGTPFDFTLPKTIGRDIADTPNGYDHNYLFPSAKERGEERKVTVREPTSGRTLSMHTTEPGFQFYSGNNLDGTFVNRAGIPLRRHYGFCLEAQKPPDAVNQPGFPSTVLRPGEEYRQTTMYRLDVV